MRPLHCPARRAHGPPGRGLCHRHGGRRCHRTACPPPRPAAACHRGSDADPRGFGQLGRPRDAPSGSTTVPARHPHGRRPRGHAHRVRGAGAAARPVARLPSDAGHALLRELVLEAIELPMDYPLGGREERVMQLILDEMERARALSLHVPMPRHGALAACCRSFVDDPSQDVGLASWAQRLHMHPRTLARLFLRETGMNFGAWCRQARLLLSLPRWPRAPRSWKWRSPMDTTVPAPSPPSSGAALALRPAPTSAIARRRAGVEVPPASPCSAHATERYPVLRSKARVKDN